MNLQTDLKYSTPYSKEVPAVMIQAQMVSQILNAAIDGRALLEMLPQWGEILARVGLGNGGRNFGNAPEKADILGTGGRRYSSCVIWVLFYTADTRYLGAIGAVSISLNQHRLNFSCLPGV